MDPELYKVCLEFIASRDGLPECTLQPAQIADIISVEEELEMSLPKDYSEYILRVGVGEEYGGLSLWYHLDISRSGNIVERKKNGGKKFLGVYDTRDGEVFGFCQNGHGFKEEVYCLDEEDGRLEPVANNFSRFLRDNLDISEDEIELAKIEKI